MNRQLYRSRRDVVLTGVAGGVAERLDWDPSLVRVAWALLVPLTGGLALLAYIVMWMVVPVQPPSARAAAAGSAPAPAAASDAEEPATATTAPTGSREPLRPPAIPTFGADRGTLVIGLLLVAAGLYFLAREWIPAIDWGQIWPVILVAAGAALLVSSLMTRR